MYIISMHAKIVVHKFCKLTLLLVFELFDSKYDIHASLMLQVITSHGVCSV